MHSKREKAMLALGLALAMVAVLFGVFVVPRLQTNQSAPTTARLVAQAPVFSSPCWSYYAVPPGCVYGLSGVAGIILSGYASEWNLIGGHQPVGDYDYMLGWGNQEHIRLPGGPWDRYAYYGAVYVAGSGCVLEFGSPWGGRFAFLHMAANSYGCSTTVQPAPSVGLDGKHLSGDERTARAVAAVIQPNAKPTAYSLPGGHYVGWSRWPDWYYYGNGSCCQADAHLCIVLDETARRWFNWVATGRDHRPWSFDYTGWNHWRVRHHESRIVPWSNPRCKGQYRCLIWPAAIYSNHRWLHGIKNLGKWYGVTKRQRYGYMIYPYSSGCAFAWPVLHRTKVVSKC